MTKAIPAAYREQREPKPIDRKFEAADLLSPHRDEGHCRSNRKHAHRQKTWALTDYRGGKGQNNHVREANQREPMKRKLGPVHHVLPRTEDNADGKEADESVHEGHRDPAQASLG